MLREKPAHLNAPSPGGSATGLSAIPRHGSSRWPSRRTEMQVAATGASSCMSPAVQKRPLGDLHANGPSPREERVEATPRRLTQGATARLGDLALLRSILLRMVRKMSLPLPQSRRTYAGSRSWSLDRHQRPMHVLRSRCHGSVPFDPASPLRKERMVRTVPRHRASSLAATIADFKSPLSGHANGADPCLLSGAKRTWLENDPTSAN